MSFDQAAYRRERLRDLQRRVEFLEAERSRLEALLGLALLVAAGGRCEAGALLDVLCAYVGTDPARPHAVELAERR